jgi:hypothetical protein
MHRKPEHSKPWASITLGASSAGGGMPESSGTAASRHVEKENEWVLFGA